MQPPKNILTNGLIILALSFGLTLPASALDFFYKVQNSAEQGDIYAQDALGGMYHLGENGVSQDYAKAFYWYQKAADQGLASSQATLGFLYTSGLGVRQDHTKAVKWFKKASEQNDALAQYSLGIRYYNGEGVRQDYTKAKEWFGKACDNGGQEGCDSYRILNEQGL